MERLRLHVRPVTSYLSEPGPLSQRSMFEAMFLAPEAQPASEGPVLSSLLHSLTNLSLGDSSGALAGGGTVGVSTANNFFSSSSL